MSEIHPKRDLSKEGKGWAMLIVILFLFPALYFACVFFPMWIGLAPVFP